MFNGGHNFVVEGGSFVVNVDNPKRVDVDRLVDMVAPNAILNAGGRADEVRCFPGTREEVIGKLEKWMSSVRDGSFKSRIMWLSGPAGAGKSAICQTVAERCRTHGQQAANFFFFRSDQTRNRAQPLVSTLVYQLRLSYPMLDELLSNYLIMDPLIFKAPIEAQFLHLISSPMQTVQQSLSTHSETIVLIIDGLDECDDSRKQDEILIALHALVNVDRSPFLVLIASRAEPHLIMSFNRLETVVESIFLDDHYRPQDDIRRFVATKFDEIKRVHHLGQMLSEDWPSKSDIDAITDKSSGQFIYAATVMRFIQYSSESPGLSLIIILEMQPSTGHHPLAQLDAVYAYIFSKVSTLRSVKQILFAYSITDLDDNSSQYKYQDCLRIVGYRPVEIISLFANLGAVIKVNMHPIKLIFYHASLYDYLKDKSRSGDYHLDTGRIAAEVSAFCLRNFHDKNSFNLAMQTLERVTEATPELTESLLGASKHAASEPHMSTQVDYSPTFLSEIERLYSETDNELCNILLQGWARVSHVNGIDPHIPAKGGVASSSGSWYDKLYRFVKGRKPIRKHK